MLRLLRWAVLLVVALIGLAFTHLSVPLDTAVSSALIAAHEPPVSSEVAEVDLGVDGTHAWSATAQLLDAIGAGGAHKPRMVLLDVIFSNTSRPDVPASTVARAISRLTAQHTDVVIVVDPEQPGTQMQRPDFRAALEPSILLASGAQGQSQMSVLRDVDRDAILAFPAWLVDDTGAQFSALPLIAVHDEREPPHAHFPFVIGNRAEMPRFTVAQVRLHPDILDDHVVVVGSLAALDSVHVVRGIDAVAWAVNDRLTTGTNQYEGVFEDDALVAILALAGASIAIALFIRIFSRTRDRAWGLLVAIVVACAVPIAALAAIYLVQANVYHSIFLQPAYPALATLLTGGLCGFASRDLPAPAVVRRPQPARLVTTPAPRPAVSLARRDLPFIWICDVSGSMSGGPINALNVAVREALPAMKTEATSLPQARVSMRSIAFSSGAWWLEPEASELADFEWNDLEATDGESDMGAALSLALEELAPPNLTPGHFPPVLVLVSDGLATDTGALERAFAALDRHPAASRATRVAIGLGADADYTALRRFSSIAPIRAEDAAQLAELIAVVAVRAVGVSSSVAGDDGMDAFERDLARVQNRRAIAWTDDAAGDEVW